MAAIRTGGNHISVKDVNGRLIKRLCLVKVIDIEDTHLGKEGFVNKIVQDKVLISILGSEFRASLKDPSDQYVWRIGDQLRVCDPYTTVAPPSICEVHHFGDSDASDSDDDENSC